MSKSALIVGVNTYNNFGSLDACVADAEEMARSLGTHKNGNVNYRCRTLLDSMEDGSPISRASLRGACRKFFSESADNILLYFSGHGSLTETGGFLCTSDAEQDDWGVPMEEIVNMATQSPASDIVIMLDCCHSGDAGNAPVLNLQGTSNPLAIIREGMTVIAASRNSESAIEAGGHGLFTAAILDALEGGAADHMGSVSAPAIYAYVSRRFGAVDQRPVYKSHTTDVNTIRLCEPLIDRLHLHRLIELFPTQDFQYLLDADYEPEDEHGNVKEPVNHQKVGIALLFKEFRDAGLLKPSTPNEQLYWTARRGGTVELTKRGREYWWLLKNRKI